MADPVYSNSNAVTPQLDTDQNPPDPRIAMANPIQNAPSLGDQNRVAANALAERGQPRDLEHWGGQAYQDLMKDESVWKSEHENLEDYEKGKRRLISATPHGVSGSWDTPVDVVYPSGHTVTFPNEALAHKHSQSVWEQLKSEVGQTPPSEQGELPSLMPQAVNQEIDKWLSKANDVRKQINAAITGAGKRQGQKVTEAWDILHAHPEQLQDYLMANGTDEKKFTDQARKDYPRMFGVTQAAGRFAGGLATPEQLGILVAMPEAKAIPALKTLLGAGFATMMAVQGGNLLRDTVTNWKDMDATERYDALTSLVLHSAATGMAAHGAYTGLKGVNDVGEATVGTKAGAEADTRYFQQAKAEKPDGTLSEWAQRAQELKDRTRVPRQSGEETREDIWTPERRAAQIAEINRAVTDPNNPVNKDPLARDIINRDLERRGIIRPSNVPKIIDMLKGESGEAQVPLTGNEESKEPDVPTFFSKLERVAMDKLPNAASGSQILSTLINNGVKPDEMNWTGLTDYLKDKPKVSKLDVQQFLDENKIQLGEVTKGGAPNFTVKRNPEETEYAGEPMYDVIDPNNGLTRFTGNFDDANDYMEKNKLNAPKFEQYTLPGEKSNYQEKLLTLPDKTRPQIDALNARLSEMASRDVQSALLRVEWDSIQKQKNALLAQPEFRSGHFQEPNVLAHVRYDDRVTPDGKKNLFLEEVQSDWHQKGKKLGYKIPITKKDTDRLNEALAIRQETHKPLKALLEKADNLGYDTTVDVLNDIAAGKLFPENIDESGVPGLRNAAKKFYEAYQTWKKANDIIAATNSGVPNAPFKSDWHELALKRMLRHAAENGYDRLMWTTGEQQANRYDLSKHTGRLHYNPTDENLLVFDPTGNTVVRNIEDVPPSKLPDYVGKDVAEKLMKTEPMTAGDWRAVTGNDLKIGGEWAKNLYDRAIPNFLNKYAKKWGAKVGEIKIPTGVDTDKLRNAARNAALNFGVDSPQYGKALDAIKEAVPETEKVHYIDITPLMKRSVMKHGQPIAKAEEIRSEQNA